jgi:hypothetical protein
VTLRQTWPAIPLAVAALLLLVLLPAPPQPQHAPNHHAPAGSWNWAGAVASEPGHRFTSVNAELVQPAVACAGAETSYATFWTGLDGYGSKTVEQVGTEAGCDRGRAFYQAWYELYPRPAVFLDLPLRPGDRIALAVSWQAAGYRLALADRTTGGGFSLTQPAPGQGASAEIIVEALAAPSGRVLPLSRFGTADFTSARIDGATLAAAGPIQLDMVGGRGQLVASTSSAAASISISSPV